MVPFDRASKIDRYGAVALGLLVVLCAFLLGWVVGVGTDDPNDASSGPPAAQSPTPFPSSGATVAGPTEDLLVRCQQVYTAQDEPLRAARAAIAQWVVHIDAMNKLVAGEITLAQATKFWDETRVGAHARLDAFATAAGRYDKRTGRCPREASRQVHGAVRTCMAAVSARNRQLSRAGRTLATWRMHVEHMEMLRRGEMSASQATALWLQSWHDGQTEMTDYRAAARAARGPHC